MADISSSILAKAFENLIEREYGHTVAPTPYITPSLFGRHTDAMLGGGFTSSIPILFTSTPESGKSTAAFHFAANFIKQHDRSVVVYIDIENAAAANDESNVMSRIDVFGIDRTKFLYKPLVVHIEQVFELIQHFVQIKKKLEDQTGDEYKVLFIWDSLASTPILKETQVVNHNEVIGLKARSLTHLLAKYKSMFLMNRVTLLIIDQVRSNIQIENKFSVKDEKGVGKIGASHKAATNVNALQHNLGQWLILSKMETLNPLKDLAVDGWTLSIYTEKNKLVSSNYSVTVVLDKKYGINPTISEYWFLANMTKWEQKVTLNNAKKLVYPLSVLTEARSKIICVFDPKTGEILKKTEKFTEKNFMEKYETDEKFKAIFDEAVDQSVKYRIKVGYFREDIDGVKPREHEELESDEYEDPYLNQLIEDYEN